MVFIFHLYTSYFSLNPFTLNIQKYNFYLNINLFQQKLLAQTEDHLIDTTNITLAQERGWR